MIHRIEPACQTPPWQQALATAITDPAVLVDHLQLDPALLPAAQRAAELFRLKVPRPFVELMRKGDPGDPLLRQVLPLGAELSPAPGFVEDPVGDEEKAVVPGILHKYQGRMLLIASGSCAVHCRYCFRRHFPYQANSACRNQWQQALDYIRDSRETDEVILSGGDPLTLTDGRLAQLIDKLSGIPHLRRLRLHTRLPVVIPRRLTPGLIDLLSSSRLSSIVVLHVNHANELGPELRARLPRIRESGVTLLNQSVLLRGVNDSVDSLSQLSLSLFECGVLPYYLHLLDRVRGAAHFEVPEVEARRLQEGIRERLPGYLVPAMVREIAGAPAKQPFF
ncbi:MAG: EF-P beta-lysylation protein EpmB [Sedimenticola sp.]|nr:EF-P beta-lysylation protein EpmB [Sedimenticola sp.]